jgi:hypothetical protein
MHARIKAGFSQPHLFEKVSTHALSLKQLAPEFENKSVAEWMLRMLAKKLAKRVEQLVGLKPAPAPGLQRAPGFQGISVTRRLRKDSPGVETKGRRATTLRGCEGASDSHIGYIIKRLRGSQWLLYRVHNQRLRGSQWLIITGNLKGKEIHPAFVDDDPEPFLDAGF